MTEQVKNTFASKSCKTMSSIDKTFFEGLADAFAFVNQQVNKRKLAIDSLTDKTVQENIIIASKIIKSCLSEGNKILVAGNGGSAAQSQHFCAELMGRMKLTRNPFNVISLCGDISTLTCIANDFGYERIFSRQIEGLAKEGDVFIGFTTSGKSRNILEAINVCNAMGIKVVLLSGDLASEVMPQCNCVIKTKLDDVCLIQEVQMQVIHMICEIVELELSSSRSVWNILLGIETSHASCLILDRDGVVNHVKSNGYISDPNEFELNDDFKRVAEDLASKFRYIFIATNQKGVGKGIMSEKELDTIHQKLIKEVESSGGRIDRIYYSTSIDNNDISRKPNIGMANQIKDDFPVVDFASSIVVGDSETDRLFANNIGAHFLYAENR